jgi:hypothetical protein
MRSSLFVLVAVLAALAQDRADLVAPKPLTTTVRSYEITGLAVSLPPTFAALPDGTLAQPAPPSSWSLFIRYTDNLGLEHVDAHSLGTDGEKYVRALILAPGAGTLAARLLQHLIDEGKIPAAKIVTPQKGK